MDKKQKIAIAAIVIVTALLSGLVLTTGGKDSAGEGAGEPAQGHQEEKAHKDGEHHGAAEASDHKDKDEHGDDEHHKTTSAKGPHGGALLAEGANAIEVVLAEDSDGARLVVYPLENGKPVLPQSVQLTAVLARPLQEKEKIPLEVTKDAFRSAASIEEPHLFDINFEVVANGRKLAFTFSKEEGKVELTADQIAAAGIKIKTAAGVRLNSGLQLPGEIRFNEDRTAHVVPQVAGVVDSVSANLGQMVKKGQVLAVISSSAISELRSEQLNAQQRLALARSTYVREKTLWEEKISAEQDYLQAQQALHEAEIAARNTQQKLRAVGAGVSTGGLNRYEVRAPFDGVVVEKHLSLGESVKEDANIFMVSDLSTVWAEIIVTPKDMNTVKVGEKAIVKATAFESSATGKISYVGSLLGEQTRSAKAHVVLQNPSNAWRPGLFVNVEVISDQTEVPVAISAEAVQSIDGKNIVFVRIPGGFMAQEVALGRTDGKQVEIKEGMKAGMPYAADGSFAIKAELGKGSAEHAH
ncbi:efflux RND transporter periplasmic adaptor subunit [Herbaspirillum sp. RV1423]|uniref:efflux RND transporter periplasmic adaptor subunit n=1 Tax=Herbaspirillum sp. RV1423 TaxID=1443993 RepID=UPI0004BC9F91|nr:efflux RND transporter periplasmic adaptor subunit [Herbaspirillum sp. RV1423]